MDKITLCGANSYQKKYYFNQEFEALPEHIKKELQILCVTYTEEVGGTLSLDFSDEGELELTVDADEADYLFDEIGSVLKIKQLRTEKQELLESLEMFFKVFYLGEDIL